MASLFDEIEEQLRSAGVRFVRDFVVPRSGVHVDVLVQEAPVTLLFVRPGKAPFDHEELDKLREAFGPGARIHLATESGSAAALPTDGLAAVYTVRRWPAEDGSADRDVRRVAEGFLREPLAAVRAARNKKTLLKKRYPVAEFRELQVLRDRSHVSAARVADTVRQIRGLFDALLDEDGRAVLDHELGELEGEFRNAHYTSCALRVGRCLEYVVYALAQDWDVSIDERPLAAMERLDARLQQLHQRIAAYSGADEGHRRRGSTDRRRARRELVAAAGELSQELIQLVSALDEETPPQEDRRGARRNVEAILRDIRKTYARRSDVRGALDAMLNSGKVRELLDIRNRAAHADSAGPREVTEHEAAAALDLLNALLLQLSGVGSALLAAEETPDA